MIVSRSQKICRQFTRNRRRIVISMEILKTAAELMFILLLTLVCCPGCYNPHMKYPGILPSRNRRDVNVNDELEENMESFGWRKLQDMDKVMDNRMDNDDILDADLTLETHIVLFNEEKVSIIDHPYQVSIEFMARHKCGGAIINSHFVVTAAHCWKYDNNLYTVRVGSSSTTSKGQLHFVSNVLQHPYYGGKGNMAFDIALVEVSPPFSFSMSVQPVEILEQTDGIIEASVTGWGVANRGFARYLQKRPVPVVSDEKCIAAYGETYTDNLICGGYEDKDPCTVEGGSPLMANGQLIGIAAKAVSCVSPSNPDVYVKLATVRGWINSNTKK